MKKPKINITFLGTAASIPTKDRDNTSFLISRKNTHFLVDCPGSIAQKLLKVDFRFKRIKNIIITHQHPDHISGIISLIHSQARLNDKLNIFSNRQCIITVKRLINIFNLNKNQYPDIEYFDVLKNNIFIRQGLTIEAIRNEHTRFSFGIKVTCADTAFFYSSDTRFSEKMLKKAGKIDLLIHDCTGSSQLFKKYPALGKMHTSSGSIRDYIDRHPDVKLIPVHFLVLDKTEERRIKKELSKIKENLIMVKDFDTVSL